MQKYQRMETKFTINDSPNDEFEQNIIDNADNGVDLAEIERIESIIESFDGD